MVYSPEASPIRSNRSPSRPLPSAKGHTGLGSLSKAAGTYFTASSLTPPVNLRSLNTGNTSGSDYFGATWGGDSSRAISPDVAGHARAKPSVQPGAKNSFASSATSSIGRTSASTSGRRKSSVQSTQTNATYATSATGVTDSSRISQVPASPETDRKKMKRKGPSQKDMLSRALQKANDAVVMDNESDLDGAVAAYEEACSLLKKVMMRSSVLEDQNKLDSIRNTYRDRIMELRGSLVLSGNEQEDSQKDAQAEGYVQDDEGDMHTERYTESAHPTLDEYVDAQHQEPFEPPSVLDQQSYHVPPRQQSLGSANVVENGERAPSRNPWQQQRGGPTANLTLPKLAAMDESVVPAPLSPWRSRSPAHPEQQNSLGLDINRSLLEPRRGHSRQDTAESTSWLDTIDESGDSTSSVHSRSSSLHNGMRRKYIIRRSGATEAEFNAALDSAIEAAYDEGLEPAIEEGELYMLDEEPHIDDSVHSFTNHDVGFKSDIRRKLEAAKERVREAEREDALVRGFDKSKLDLRSGRQTPAQKPEILYEGDEMEEEERMLAEMREYASEAPSTQAPITHLLHGSETSNLSRNARTSSGGSIEASGSAGVSAPNLSKFMSSLPPIATSMPPPTRPPSLALPPVTGGRKPADIVPPLSSSSAFAPAIVSPGVRERRLSGRKAGNLTIDTGVKLEPGLSVPDTTSELPSGLSPIDQVEADQAQKFGSIPDKSLADHPSDGGTLAAPAAIDLAPEVGSASPVTSYFNRTPLSETRSMQGSAPPSPTRSLSRPGTASALRKNFSTTSLRSLKNAVVTPITADNSPQTPISRIFSGASHPGKGAVPSVPELPTPAVANFGRHGMGQGSLSFFNTDIHSVRSPGTPNPSITNGPASLEPCPESFLLRPFWLLRCIYQTIANPHGGYLSTRLFVPRDIWRVRNVKIKNVEEKVAQCDLLTAALLKLARTDTHDADAVLEEMQSFELILDQVQVQLQKKLGAEVGVQGAMPLFKAHGDDSGIGGGTDGRSNTTTSKLSSSWRRLRSKNSSGPGLPSAGGAHSLGREVRETLTMKSLPMTGGAVVPKKHVKRNATKVLGVGPNANYMAALARLSDAAQILDQIARQVEDPGLRLSSQTHVGLELCTRHAAEFFAFYVCRFALTDIGAMLDKFVKRGSEWIMA